MSGVPGRVWILDTQVGGHIRGVPRWRGFWIPRWGNHSAGSGIVGTQVRRPSQDSAGVRAQLCWQLQPPTRPSSVSTSHHPIILSSCQCHRRPENAHQRFVE